MAATAKLIDQAFQIPSCSFFVDGCYPNYILWYISPTKTRVDIWELDVSNKDEPVGLRLDFAHKITDLGCICIKELNSGYILYLLSASGTAYRVNITDFSNYGTSHLFSADELVEIDSNCFAYCPSTYIAATTNFLALGKVDGSVSCFPIRIADEDAQGFQLLETPSSSQYADDQVESLALPVGDQFVVVLHSQGKLRVWDLNIRVMVYSQYLNHSLGSIPSRLWAGVLEVDTIPSHILYNDHVGQNVVSNTSIVNQNRQTFIILQENSELCCGRRVMETTGLLEWISPWVSTTVAGDFEDVSVLKFVNWEFSGGFNYPHKHQTEKICWVYVMCDQLEAAYSIMNSNAKSIHISKQYILDYIPVSDEHMLKSFGRQIEIAYRWAVQHPLVLEEDYDYPFTGIRQSQRDVKPGRRLRIGDLMEHSGDKQGLIEGAISTYPVAASIFLRKPEVSRLRKKSSRPYCLFDDPDIESYKRHAVVLSGMVSYHGNMRKLDSYFVKDPQYTVPSGRFFLKKFYSLRECEYSALRCVVYPRTLSLD